MAKRIPVDCKRIRPEHLSGLDEDKLAELALRIEVQTQALNRARRLVSRALDSLRR